MLAGLVQNLCRVCHTLRMAVRVLTISRILIGGTGPNSCCQAATTEGWTVAGAHAWLAVAGGGTAAVESLASRCSRESG